MIYLPRPRERYLAALRLHIQKSCLRGKENSKHFAQLKKIMLCEALVSKNDKSPVDIPKYSDSLLGAAVIILLQSGRRLSVRLSGGGVFLINRRIFTALLLTLADSCSENGNIFIFSEGNRITVRLKGIRLCCLHKTLVNALEGVLLKAVNEDRVIISLPVRETNQKPESFLNEWALLLDKFSPVNIFLMRNS